MWIVLWVWWRNSLTLVIHWSVIQGRGLVYSRIGRATPKCIWWAFDSFAKGCPCSQVFKNLKYFLKALFWMKMTKSKSVVGGWSIDYCFWHILVESYLTQDQGGDKWLCFIEGFQWKCGGWEQVCNCRQKDSGVCHCSFTSCLWVLLVDLLEDPASFVEYFFFCGLATVHTDMYAKVSNSFIALGTVENFMCAIRVGED